MLTEAQREERLGLMTSSVVAGVFGVDPYGGPLTAQQLILGGIAERGEMTVDKAAALRRGNLCEEACLRFAAEELGAAGWEKPPFVRHPNGWSGDSADALFYDKRGNLIAAGEAKTVAGGAVDKWGTPGTDEVPDHVLLQCYWHMLHHPVDMVAVPVLMGGWRFSFSLYVVERNEQLMRRIVGDVEAWYRQHITRRLPVPPGAGDESTLRAIYPRDAVPSTEMTQEIERWAREKVLWSKAVQRAEARESEAKNRLRALLGEAGAATGDAVSVTNRASKASDKTDWRALALSMHPGPEAIARFTRQVPGSRRLTVNVREDASSELQQEAESDRERAPQNVMVTESKVVQDAQ